MEKKLFGYIDGLGEISLYRLENEDAALTLTDFGAAVVGFCVFGTDIIGGFDSLQSYIKDDSHQGGTIGRVANRVGGACFTMDGVEYRLPNNDKGNCLHSGRGFDRRMWQLDSFTDDSITFFYRSEDTEEGFPSNLDVYVTYTLSGSAMCISYKAVADGRTPIALTNHSYFNLDGFGSDILDHEIQILADRYTEVGADLIPTGARPAVAGTPLDFNTPERIGSRIDQTSGGYDHNYILCPDITSVFGEKHLPLVARARGKRLEMSVYTDQKNMQFYTGNFLGDGPDFKGGIKQLYRGAFCFETQTEPNCIKRGEAIYSAGEEYIHNTVYKVEKMN